MISEVGGINMKKIKDYTINESVRFTFLGEIKTGVVFNVNDKENKLMVKDRNGIVYQVKQSEKESNICYLI